MSYYINELFRQLTQKLFGLWIFSLPGIRLLRITAYRIAFSAGSNFEVGEDVFISRNHHAVNGTIRIGKDVNIARHTKIDYVGQVVIEDGVAIGEGSYILSHQHLMLNRDEVLPAKVIIKEGAWIGAHSKIVPSSKKHALTIGRCSVIAAGAVINKNVPDFAIVSGNPYRFSPGLNLDELRGDK